jgi:hypothetical protein
MGVPWSPLGSNKIPMISLKLNYRCLDTIGYQIFLIIVMLKDNDMSLDSDRNVYSFLLTCVQHFHLFQKFILNKMSFI